MLRSPLLTPRGPERRCRLGVSGIVGAGMVAPPSRDPRQVSRRRRQEDRAAKRILVLADDPADGEGLAMELSREGYAAPTADFSDLPHLRMTPMPELAAVCLSSRLERVLELCRRLREFRDVAILLVSRLRLPELEGPFHLLPIVSAVLFRPYTRAALIAALEGALTDPVVGLADPA